MALAQRAAANAVRGLGGSLPLALLGPMLAHRLGADDFAAWILVVQLAAYVMYLEFGVQTAVSRSVAFATAGGDLAKAASPINAGLAILTISAIVGALLTGIGAALFPAMFDIAPSIADDAQLAVLILGVAAAVALPASALQGALLGIGANWSTAVIVVSSRLFSVALTVWGASRGWSLPALAATLASGSLVTATLPFVAALRCGLPLERRRPRREELSELGQLSATLGLWTVAMLLISGLDVVIVGVVDIEAVAAYGLAASLVLMITGAYSMLFSVLLPAFAEHASRGEQALGLRLLLRSNALSSTLLGSGLIFSLAIEPVVLDRWAGQYAGDAHSMFRVLLVAGVVRLSLAPFSTYVMGVGAHRLARWPAVLEAVLNVSLSIVLGLVLGAIGVAVATLIASVVAFGVYLIRIAPKVLPRESVSFSRVRSFLAPTLVATPAVAILIIAETPLIRAFVAIAGISGLLVLGRASVSWARAHEPAGPYPTFDDAGHGPISVEP